MSENFDAWVFDLQILWPKTGPTQFESLYVEVIWKIKLVENDLQNPENETFKDGN